jgi:putative adhesin
MSVISPPDPEAGVVDETARSPQTATPTQAPVAAPPPAASYAETTVEPPERKRASGIVAGVILITLGVVVLFGTWFPAGGAWLFVGLGAAFLIARVLTRHSGYAVPAGILLGFGAFVWATETGMLSGSASGGLFFVFLGLGFLAAYAIAARPQAVWPVIPAVVLIGFGAFVQATTVGVPFSQFWWLAQYWPLSLVALGAWLLARDRLPAEVRTPVAVVGASALILIGLLVAAAGMASVAVPYARVPMPMPWSPFGMPPIQDTITLNAPATAIDSIRLVNTSGTTVVRPGSGSDVTVQATRHYWNPSQPPDVALVPTDRVLVIQANQVELGGNPGTYVDYVVTAPAALGADVRSASGSITLNGLAGPVRIETASGSIDARDLPGATTITTASGAIRMNAISGDLRVGSTSGSVNGTGVDRVSDAHSTSGSIDLSGRFSTDAQIATTSGSVALRFTSGSAGHLNATSSSGTVSANGLPLTGMLTGPHSLSGDLAGGGPNISVHTTSGSIQLARGF